MSNEADINENKTLTEFTGFHLSEKGKKRLEYMGKWFLERKMTKSASFSDAARKCIDIGWTIVSEAEELSNKGEPATTVTFTLPQIPIPPSNDQSESS